MSADVDSKLEECLGGIEEVLDVKQNGADNIVAPKVKTKTIEKKNGDCLTLKIRFCSRYYKFVST